MRLRVKQDATECSRNIMFEIVDISTIAASHQTKLLMPLLKQADLLVVLVNELHQMELEQSFQLCHRLVTIASNIENEEQKKNNTISFLFCFSVCLLGALDTRQGDQNMFGFICFYFVFVLSTIDNIVFQITTAF